MGRHSTFRLRFEEYFEYVCQSFNKFCGLLKRVKQVCPQKCPLKFWKSIAKPIMSYGSPKKDQQLDWNWKKTEQEQKRFLKGIFFWKIFDSVAKILYENGTSTVFELYTVEFSEQLLRHFRFETPVHIFSYRIDPGTNPMTRSLKNLKFFMKSDQLAARSGNDYWN